MGAFDPGPGSAGPGAAEQPELVLPELVDAAPVGLAILDPELRYLSINPALAAMDGLAPDEHIGRSVAELLPELAGAVEPALRGVLRTGRPLVNRELSGDSPARAGGRGHWLASVHPLRDAQGDVAALGLVVIDVTARTRAEQDLRASERRFRAVVEAMDDLVFTLDAEGRYRGVFGRWLERYGFVAEEFVGRTPREVLGHLRSAVHEGAARRALAGEHVVYEWSMERGGEERFFHTALSPLEAGGPERVVGVSRDITDRRLAERDAALARARAEALLRRLEAGLVPRGAPLGPDWRVAWGYRAAEELMLLGGDFMGVAGSRDGSVSFVVGDVAGRGPEAAGIGATLRATWRGLVQAGVSLPELPGALQEVLLEQEGADGRFVTATLGRIDRTGSSLSFVRAGHEPPLMIDPLQVSIPTGGHGPPLGLFGDAIWDTETVELPAGGSVLLYTDGAVEGRAAPGSRDRFGLSRLIACLPLERATHGDLAGAVDVLMREIVAANGGRLADDVALMLVGRRA